MKRHVFVALFAALVVATTPAGANNTAAAQALFEEGRALMGKGDFIAACAKVKTSNRSPVTEYFTCAFPELKTTAAVNTIRSTKMTASLTSDFTISSSPSSCEK